MQAFCNLTDSNMVGSDWSGPDRPSMDSNLAIPIYLWMILPLSLLMNHRFVGYQTVSDFNLRSADCLCYKEFPSLEDIWFNHRKVIVYIFYCLLRKGFRNITWPTSMSAKILRCFLNITPDKFWLFPYFLINCCQKTQMNRVARCNLHLVVNQLKYVFKP